MYSRPFTTFLLSLLLLFAACEGQRITIDKKSCTSDVYPDVKKAIDNAIRWADEAGDAIGRPTNEMDPRIAKKVSLLLGDDAEAIKKVAAGFKKIGQIKHVDADVYTEPFKSHQRWNDIAFVCNFDYLQLQDPPDFPDYPYLDRIRNQYIGENEEIVKMKTGRTGLPEMATHYPTTFQTPNKDNKLIAQSDLLLTPPSVIKSNKDMGWPGLTEERIKKAVNPSFAKKVDDAVENFSQNALSLFFNDKQLQSSVTLVNTYERCVLHELTHTRGGLASDDVPKGKCYGWLNAVKCRDPKNADSLAWLAVSIQMITHFGYDVTEKGKVVKIK